jgi:hypothetical protein
LNAGGEIVGLAGLEGRASEIAAGHLSSAEVVCAFSGPESVSYVTGDRQKEGSFRFIDSSEHHCAANAAPAVERGV